MQRIAMSGALLALGLAGCAGGDDETAEVAVDSAEIVPEAMPAAGGEARAVLRTADGTEVGTITLTTVGAGVQLMGDLAGVPAGEHGFHFHTVGMCEAPSFDSAGDHFNPTNASHGSEHPQGPHAGDMMNIAVPEGGSTHAAVMNDMVSLMDGQPNSLFDADGAALVLHADPDDYETQPSGNAGAPFACGVVERA